MRQLIIMRHAKSDWHSNAGSDFDRPLNKRGEKDAPRMGQYLLDKGFVPDEVIASPARRARQTARKACREMGIDEDAIQYADSLYLCGVEEMLGVMANADSLLKRLMLVSHNPAVDELLHYLCNNDLPYNSDGKLMTTAACAIIELPDNWQQALHRRGKLLELVRPREIN